jgi:type I restriction enzyme S subunit
MDRVWETVRVNEIATEVFDGPFGSHLKTNDYTPRGVRVVRLENIGHLCFFADKETFISPEKFKTLSRHVLKKDDVIFSSFVSEEIRVCLLPGAWSEKAINKSDCFCIRVDPRKCLPKFLELRLASRATFTALGENIHGATRPRINLGQLKNYSFSLPPLAEQKRIADKLEAVLGRVDACRARLDRVPALLKRFRQSVLAAATSGKLTEEWREERNATGGAVKTLGEVIRVSSGKALTAKNMAEGGAIPVFGGNGINGYHNEGNVFEETLVIGRVGYYCGCVHMTPTPAWVTDNALIVRHDPTESEKRFLFYALRALDLRTNDAATAQPVISGQKIYSLTLKLPSLPEQQEIVRRVEALFAFADRIEARLATARKTVERLTPATLAKAFRGELVPQDPNDEPASALLERLHAQTDPASAKSKRGRRAK